MATFLLPERPVLSWDDYEANGGGAGLRRAVELGPAETIEEIAASGLRGRGGGGFPTGRKWRGVAGQEGTHRYVVANAAEGEPGTFKDRALIRANPYQLVEGVVIAAFAVRAEAAFISLKAAFTEELAAVTRAVQEMQDAGLCRDCGVTLVGGPEEYLFGEEKAMLLVIEGGPPLPRLLPPYEHGLFATAPQTGWSATPSGGHVHGHESNPTLVNNAETLSNVPHILARGAGWHRGLGDPSAPGHLVVTVSGDVRSPGVREVPTGVVLRQVLDDVGGGTEQPVKAVLSGVANPVLRGEDLDLALTYDTFAARGSGLGAAGFIVFDESACMVEVARLVSRFLSVESCGQCPPCKLGSAALTDLLGRVEAGTADESDFGHIESWLEKVTDGNRCYLAVQEQQVVASFLRAFPEEFVEHGERGCCPRPRPVTLPKLVELDGGSAVYDTSHDRKWPDWTYRDELHAPRPLPTSPPPPLPADDAEPRAGGEPAGPARRLLRSVLGQDDDR